MNFKDLVLSWQWPRFTKENCLLKNTHNGIFSLNFVGIANSCFQSLRNKDSQDSALLPYPFSCDFQNTVQDNTGSLNFLFNQILHPI